jgi:hypothetical protein
MLQAALHGVKVGIFNKGKKMLRVNLQIKRVVLASGLVNLNQFQLGSHYMN